MLKGPAALLFGRIEPAASSISPSSVRSGRPIGRFEQQVGNFGFVRTTVDVTGPLTADKSVLYRFNGEYYRTDSFRDFVNDRSVFLAPTITLHPIEQFRMNIDFEYQNRTWVENSELFPAIGDRPANIPISRYFHPRSLTTAYPDHIERKRIAYDWTYDFAPDWSLTNRLSYSNTGAARSMRSLPASIRRPA